MIRKLLIPVIIDEVAPRFDLATEVMIIILSRHNDVEEERTIVLPQASAEKLCHLVLTESINVLICGAIEDEYYQFLKWKQVVIFDSVAGKWQQAFQRYQDKTLMSGDILCERIVEGQNV
ncbi:MAG: hypothetical protein V1793_02995 [Pseudomonadota bacterium]